MTDNKYVLDTKCQNCGADIDLNLDNLIGFCPYCGTKLLVDPIAFKEVLIEKEKTKRASMKFAHEKELIDSAEEKDAKLFKLKLAIGIAGAICIFIGYVGSDFIGFAASGFMMVGMIAFIALLLMSDGNKKADD